MSDVKTAPVKEKLTSEVFDDLVHAVTTVQATAEDFKASYGVTSKQAESIVATAKEVDKLIAKAYKGL